MKIARRWWWSLWWSAGGDGADEYLSCRGAKQGAACLQQVGPWLEGKAGPDAKVAASAELQAQLKLQDEAAVALRAERVRQGALEFSRAEADPVVVDGQVQRFGTAAHNHATD